MRRDGALILRYRDPGPKTIPQHQAIIARDGAVWWGWWRKEGIEPNGLDLLEKYADRSSFPVALVDRDAPAMSLAECTRLVYDVGGGRFACPAPESCPEYYRNESCAAWFLLTGITPLGSASYNATFGGLPVGNPTLYESRKGKDGKQSVFPRPGWDLTPVVTTGSKILHISDVHFGSFHGYPVARASGARRPREIPLHDVLLENLEEDSDDIGVVVLSGDCLSRGENSAITALETFLEELSAGLNLEAKNFVIVPGNHDFHILDSEDYLPTTDYSHERDFRRFMENFYGRPKVDLERLQRFRTPAGWDLTFMALNSARLRDIASKEYGYVGRHRYSEMLNYARSVLGSRPLMSEKRMLTTVLHHHLSPVPQTELLPPAGRISLTVDAAELKDAFQEAGVQLVLHGHQHLPFIEASRRGVRQSGRLVMPPEGETVHILGMGSTGAGVEALADELRENSYGVYEPSEGGLKVRINTFNRVRRPEIYMDTTLKLCGSTGE